MSEEQISKLEREIELAYQALEASGVPRKRARSLHNGIAVLAQRMHRSRAVVVSAHSDELARQLQPELERAGWGLSLASIAAVLDALDVHHRASGADSRERRACEWERMFDAWVKHQAGLPSEVPLWPNPDWSQDVAMVAFALAEGGHHG